MLETWREALPDRVIVAGARDITMAIEARRGHADALLAFPEPADPVAHHARLSRELPVIAFWLYEAAGGVAYDDATLHALLDLPGVIGIKVATLDSVMTFQRIAGAHARAIPTSCSSPARTASSAIRSCSARARRSSAWARRCPICRPGCSRAYAERRLAGLSRACRPCATGFAQATFTPPMEGYVRRMLWAAAADGALPGRRLRRPLGTAAARRRSAPSVERVVRGCARRPARA